MEVTFTEIGTIANRKRGPARLPDYAQELAAFHRAFERELRALVASLPIGRDMRVIDVGCGDGFYTGLFAEHLHSTGSITGFDSNADYLKMARDRLSSRAVACEVSLIQGRLERITELAGQFDVVWCAQSLFSLPEPIVALEQMATMLRPGGLILVLENDTLHQLLLPWPSRLELAVRKAELAALCDQTVHADKFYVGRHLPELFVTAGLEPLAIRSQSIDRQSPFDSDLCTFLTAYLSRLTQRVTRYLDSATSHELLRTVDSRSGAGLLRQPFATITWMNMLAWARKGAARKGAITTNERFAHSNDHNFSAHFEGIGTVPASRGCSQTAGPAQAASQAGSSGTSKTHGGFHLKRKESARRGMRRLVRYQIDNLQIFLVQFRAGRDSIHDIRKTSKKARALLRLVRRDLGRDVYREVNAHLRDSARKFRAARDAQVLVATLDEIVRSANGDLDEAVTDWFRDRLLAEARQTAHDAASPALLDSIVTASRDFQSQSRQWKLKCNDWTDLLQAVRRTYRSARSAWQDATAGPTVKNLHEWRKQAKYLSYEMDVLTRVGPRAIRRLKNRIDRLTKILGEDHDLALLGQTLETAEAGLTVSLLIAATGKRRTKLQKQAFRFGEQLFRDIPQVFTARLS